MGRRPFRRAYGGRKRRQQATHAAAARHAPFPCSSGSGLPHAGAGGPPSARMPETPLRPPKTRKSELSILPASPFSALSPLRRTSLRHKRFLPTANSPKVVRLCRKRADFRHKKKPRENRGIKSDARSCGGRPEYVFRALPDRACASPCGNGSPGSACCAARPE